MTDHTSDTLRHSAAFIQQQNLLRGALSYRRSRSFFTTPQVTQDHTYRTNIRRVLMRARAVLDASEFSDFLAWYDRLRRIEFSHGEANIGFGYLNGVIEGPTIAFAKEIGWVVERLKIDSDVLNEFRASATQLDADCVSGNFVNAIHNLARIVASHGESMWSVQLRLALEQRAYGLEAQKSYLEHVRSQYRQGILSYVGYNTSVRNEDRTSWQRFADGVRQASARRKDRALANYLNYRLLGEWPLTASGIASVIRIEQSHSIIDIYETFVGICQLVISSEGLAKLRPTITSAVNALDVIDDFRLRKIVGAPTHAVRDGATVSALAAGKLGVVIKQTRSASVGDVDPWIEIYQAAAIALSEKERRPKPGLFSSLLPKVMMLRGSTAGDAAELQKLCHNFAGLPVAKGIACFLHALHGTDAAVPLRFDGIGLNSPRSGPEDHDGLAVVLDQQVSAFPTTRKLAAGLKAFSQHEYDAANAALVGLIPQEIPPALARLRSLLWLRLSDVVDDFEAVVQTISLVGSEDPSIIPLLPVRQLLGERPPRQFKLLANRLAAINALNMLWKSADNEAAGSTLKLLTGQFLRSHPRRRPSLLADDLSAHDRSELVYFLREVCVPNVLDVSRVFNGSKEVFEERQAICVALHNIDPARASEYSAESAAITRRLIVDEGLKIVDQSRIHVDTDAISRWANRNLTEDYERYADLVDAGIGASGNYDDTIREILEAARHGKQAEFFTPQNEADNTLVRILSSLSDEFLNSPTAGLDYFLSKRIRHVSFIGLVRGPLEFSNLIANKPTPQSDYRANKFWSGRLLGLATEEQTGVDEAIKRFSKTFDDAVNRLKADVLHVRSSEHPNGLFSIPLTSTLLSLARALLSDATSFADFVDSVFVIFWTVLEFSLAKARQTIDDLLKMQIANAMDELKAEISAYAYSDPTFSELNAAMAQAGSDVQAALGEVSSWFTRPEIQVVRYFSIEEALEVAIESALRLHRGFSPEITRVVGGDIGVATPDLVFITDAVLIAFSNIKAYSKLRTPKVTVSLSLDRSAETITVEITNEVHPSARSAAQDRRIADIRQSIDAGISGKKSRTEGGSGFVKLAAVAQQSTKGRVDFGYSSQNAFRLSVTYSIIIDPSEGEAPK